MSEATDRLPAQAVAAIPKAPLPEWPQGWYAIARSRALKPGQLRSVTLAGQEIVVFRTVSGALGALDAHCPHIGAHLAHGRVRGEHLECALHCWRIAIDGTIAQRAPRARVWPVREQAGLILIEHGTGRPVPGARDAQFVWTAAAPLDLAVQWHGVMANAFDMPHLCNVHGRELVAPPQVSMEAGRQFSLQYVSRVRGRAVSDRIMKWISGDRIHVRLVCHGTLLVIETDLGSTRTAACVGMWPTPQGTRLFPAFGVRRGRLQALRLMLTRALFTAFLRRDLGVIEGMRLRTDVDDPTLQMLFDFLRTLRPARA
jgi:nitrite reductase/ring-hydroxylating ferredoxin subunit